MVLQPAVTWALVTGAFLTAEVLLGTFYCAVFAASATAAGIASALGVAPWGQGLVFAAFAGAAFVLALPQRLAARQAPELLAQDVGVRLTVTDITAEGDLQVHHRGSGWNARPLRPGPVRVGDSGHLVRIDGDTLVVKFDG